jgi:hypothetical protein
MEIPGDLKPDLQRTLLGPLSLATELFGVLIPGSVFLILTCVKCHWAAPILTYSLVGYPTKVVLAVLASYIIGKVSLSAIVLISDSIEWFGRKLKPRKKEDPLPANHTALQSLVRLGFNWMESAPSWFKNLLVGMAGASVLSNKSDLFHHYTASKAESSFHLNTGLVLILASFIRGDGNFRGLEAFAGAILLAAGIKQTFENRLLMAGSFGMVINEYLMGQSPEKVIGILAGILKFLVRLAKIPAGSEVVPPASSATKNATEEATEEIPKAASAPEEIA